MGVDYSVAIGVGKQFESKSETIAFIEEHLSLTEEEYEDMDSDLGSFTYKSVQVDCLDCYSGNSWFVGVPFIQRGTPEGFLNDVIDSIQGWKEVFPNVEAELVCEVSVW